MPPQAARQRWAVRSPRLLRSPKNSWACMRPPEFWSRDDRTSRFIRALLTPVGWLYGASVARKARQAHPYRFNGHVICVGNLTTGGTGKTPIAMTIARQAIARGFKTAFLTRGYG